MMRVCVGWRVRAMRTGISFRGGFILIGSLKIGRHKRSEDAALSAENTDEEMEVNDW